jgi:hypothetical protein
MGNNSDGKNKKNYRMVSDESALFLDKKKEKIDRKGDDGTTIVFYSFPEEDIEVEINTKTTNLRNKDKEGPKEIANTTTKSIYQPLNDLAKEHFLKTTKELEGIADIKFFDINNLSDDDKKYLSKNNVTIPETPDINGVSFDNSREKDNPLGIGSYPTKQELSSDKKTLTISTINHGICAISTQVCSEETLPDMKFTILHELGHNLGLKHPFDTESGNKKILREKFDNTANTVTSYTQKDNYGKNFTPTGYQELDVKALVKLYGNSKNPTPGLEEMLAQEETKQAEMAFKPKKIESFLKTLEKKIKKLTEDGVFDKEDLEDLSKTAIKLRDKMAPETLTQLKEKNIKLELADSKTAQDYIIIGDGSKRAIELRVDNLNMEGIDLASKKVVEMDVYKTDVFDPLPPKPKNPNPKARE